MIQIWRNDEFAVEFGGCRITETKSGIRVTAEDGSETIVIHSPRDKFVEVLDEHDNVFKEIGDGQSDMVMMLARTSVMIRSIGMPESTFSKDEIDRSRREIDVEVVGGEPEQIGAPDRLTDMVAWFQARLEEVPAAYRQSAVVDFGHRDVYDLIEPLIVITYRRPETDEEVIKRLTTERHREEVERRRELETLERLKRKYEP